MILTELKRYLLQRGQASLQDIAVHCDAEPDAVRGMLEQWIRKGRVERRLLSDSCSTGCDKCDPNGVEFYRWVDSDQPQAASDRPGCPSR